MADEKEKAHEKKNQADGSKQDNESTKGHGSSGGNMGAGQSGQENLGSEKPSDNETMGSQKPGDAGAQE